MSSAKNSEELVLILAPVGQDGLLIAQVLESVNIRAEVVVGLDHLTEKVNQEPHGALIIAEEALSPSLISAFVNTISAQETWSDVPIILMTGNGEASKSSLQMLHLFTASGNVTLLERPCRAVTLTSILQAALRARKRQYEVRRLILELAASVQQRDEFMSIASHELKTPLTSLKLQTQLAERAIRRGDTSYQSAEKLKKLILNTGHQLDRLTRLVEDMLDMSRINTGMLSITQDQTNLSQMLVEIIDRFTPQFNEAECEIRIHIQPNIWGEWDGYRIEQVITNLITNALKYSAGKPVEISLQDGGATASLMVRDEGPGIAVEDQARIFERFERAVRASNISGLGLGLYISRQIVESHGGTIQVESKLGAGSSFKVVLPKLRLNQSLADDKVVRLRP